MNIREKILIVEDEKSIAHFISTILNSNDYETLLARSGSEAKTMISSHCPDLVILDLGLPDMDGIDVLRELRSWSSLVVKKNGKVGEPRALRFVWWWFPPARMSTIRCRRSISAQTTT